jgi:hypothetical protein
MTEPTDEAEGLPPLNAAFAAHSSGWRDRTGAQNRQREKKWPASRAVFVPPFPDHLIYLPPSRSHSRFNPLRRCAACGEFRTDSTICKQSVKKIHARLASPRTPWRLDCLIKRLMRMAGNAKISGRSCGRRPSPRRSPGSRRDRTSPVAKRGAHPRCWSGHERGLSGCAPLFGNRRRS